MNSVLETADKNHKLRNITLLPARLIVHLLIRQNGSIAGSIDTLSTPTRPPQSQQCFSLNYFSSAIKATPTVQGFSIRHHDSLFRFLKLQYRPLHLLILKFCGSKTEKGPSRPPLADIYITQDLPIAYKWRIFS